MSSMIRTILVSLIRGITRLFVKSKNETKENSVKIKKYVFSLRDLTKNKV
jgi:hypothetical protein